MRAHGGGRQYVVKAPPCCYRRMWLDYLNSCTKLQGTEAADQTEVEIEPKRFLCQEKMLS